MGLRWIPDPFPAMGASTIVKVEIKDYTASQTTLAMDIYPTLLAKVHSDTLEVTAFGTLPRNHDLTVLAERTRNAPK